MSYCNEKKQAIVTYSFAGGEVKRFETDKVPIDVTTGYADNASGVGLHELKGFPGDNPGSYSFTIEAPSGVPRNLNPKPDIYLLAGLWDDYGTIGTFATEVGIVKGYEGNPIKVGTGYEITGTVVNVQPVNCYARVDLEWRWGGCQIVISHAGKTLYKDTGTCPCKFTVACDDECPPGYFKCECDSYPGYCCVSCSEMKSEIAALRKAFRR